jgi:Fe-S cluster biogenesis protein NfuA
MKPDMEQNSTTPKHQVDMHALMETLDFIRPALHGDGGDLIYHGVDDEGIVRLELLGACGTCPLSIVTLVSGIERLVLQRVSGATGVVAYSPAIPELSSLGE